MRDAVRIAILGTRGIPASYGGFETFAEELSTRLAARGHQVTVYCRERIPKPIYRGVRLQYLPTIRHKYFDTLAHTFLSTLHLLAHRVDAALYCNAANAMFTLLPRMFGMPVALNVDGIERKRKKWNRAGESLVSGLGMAGHVLPDRRGHRRADHSGLLPRALRQATRLHSLRRGSRQGGDHGGARQARPGAGRYFLYVSRMEPENHPLEVRQAFERVATDHASWR